MAANEEWGMLIVMQPFALHQLRKKVDPERHDRQCTDTNQQSSRNRTKPGSGHAGLEFAEFVGGADEHVIDCAKLFSATTAAENNF